MLAFKFQLTEAQVRLLLVMYFGEYEDIGNPNGIGRNPTLLPRYRSNNNSIGDMITPGKALIHKGLISHCNNRNPTWLITESGEAVARMIVKEATEIVKRNRKRKVIVVSEK